MLVAIVVFILDVVCTPPPPHPTVEEEEDEEVMVERGSLGLQYLQLMLCVIVSSSG